ncbi:MAG TPA: hypothetical protein VFS83_16100 [Ktedonobacterales bacterium]|nr:hypothetical protein [Ktedonobacterales bacterium]
MDTTHGDMAEREQTPLSDESLPPFVAYQVEEESRERALVIRERGRTLSPWQSGGEGAPTLVGPIWWISTSTARICTLLISPGRALSEDAELPAHNTTRAVGERQKEDVTLSARKMLPVK